MHMRCLQNASSCHLRPRRNSRSANNAHHQKEVRMRCRLFQEGKWRQLYEDSARYAPDVAGDPSASHAAEQQAASR